ncbi:diguanylate cyclase [Paludisphaera soli]|uniref:diguanylate cyclase n=1 Tax=Paludisphaera soli TaxID=2712865 RepID=UPI0013ED8A59|nr:diguanylate cyclase [Paludisphaera soli]
MNRSKSRRPSAPPRPEFLERRDVPAMFGNAWPIPQSMSISFVPDGTRIGSFVSDLDGAASAAWGPDWQLQVLAAFQAWAVPTGVNFALRADEGLPLGSPGYATNSAKFGDVRVAAHPMPPDVIAYSIPYDSAVGTWAGDLILNSDYVRGALGATPLDLYTVVLHEAGNLLGLPDSEESSSPRHFTYDGPKTSLTPGDVGAIRALYGPRQPDRHEGPSGNGTAASATPVEVGAWGPAEAVLADLGLGDVDVYRISTPVGTERVRVRLATAGFSLLTGRLTVTDADGRLLGWAVATDPRAGVVEVLIQGEAAGRDLFVEVRGARGDAFDVGSYALVADTADGADEAIERLMFKTVGVMYVMSSLESGLPSDPQEWSPMLRTLYKVPPGGLPASYTAAMDAAIGREVAALGGRPFDLDAFVRLGGRIATVEASTLLEPGMMTAILEGLQRYGRLEELIRDVWGRADLRGALHEAIASGALEEEFRGRLDSGSIAGIARDLWASDAVRAEVFGLIESGGLDDVIDRLIGSGAPEFAVAAADPLARRKLASEWLAGLGTSGRHDAEFEALARTLMGTEGVPARILDLLRAGAIDQLAQGLLFSDAADIVTQAVLAAASRSDPAIMATLFRAFFPPPNADFASAPDLVPFWSSLGATANYLVTIATTDDARPATLGRFTVPRFDGVGPAVVVVSVIELVPGPSRPVLRVFDAHGRPVAAEVLDASGSTYRLQIGDPVPGATYFVEVAGIGEGDGPVSGVYFLGASFERAPVEFEPIAVGRPVAASYEAPETQLVHWVLSVREEGGREGVVRMRVVDASGTVVHVATVRTGEEVGMALHLPVGRYRLFFEPTSADGAPSWSLTYELRGKVMSDSINPRQLGMALTAGGLLAPETPAAQAAPDPEKAAGGRTAPVEPSNSPQPGDVGGEGPVGRGFPAQSRGPAGRGSAVALRAGAVTPAGAVSLRAGAVAAARRGDVLRIDGEASAMLPRYDPRPSAAPAAPAPADGDRRVAIRVVDWRERPPAEASEPLDLPLGSAARLLPHVLAVEALDGEARSSEALLAAGLVAWGAARTVVQRRAGRTGPGGPMASSGARPPRPAAGRERGGEDSPGRVLLIRTSARSRTGGRARRWLEADGADVREATPADWESDLAASPDVILLEHDPDAADGVALLLRIRAERSAAEIPILIFSDGDDSAALAERGLDLGAADVLPRTIAAGEFRARVRRVMRLRREIEDLEREAARDGLTGLGNRAALAGRLAVAWSDCRRRGRPIGLLIADLDHFKRVNDTRGHLVGDEVLRRVAGALAAEVDGLGFAARYGGEEFAVVVPGVDLARVLRIAEGVRRRVGALAVDDLGLPGPLTVSIGVAWAQTPASCPLEELLARADRALYLAKDAGRDAVRMLDDLEGGTA